MNNRTPMEEDIENIYVEFHQRARELFFSLLRDFNASIEGISRRRDEYQFRWQREQYVHRLQQQLEDLAKELITRHESIKKMDQLSQNLHHFIKDYLHQFIQKVKAL
jgi:hypothetical protein